MTKIIRNTFLDWTGIQFTWDNQAGRIVTVTETCPQKYKRYLSYLKQWRIQEWQETKKSLRVLEVTMNEFSMGLIPMDADSRDTGIFHFRYAHSLSTESWGHIAGIARSIGYLVDGFRNLGFTKAQFVYYNYKLKQHSWGQIFPLEAIKDMQWVSTKWQRVIQEEIGSQRPHGGEMTQIKLYI